MRTWAYVPAVRGVRGGLQAVLLCCGLVACTQEADRSAADDGPGMGAAGMGGGGGDEMGPAAGSGGTEVSTGGTGGAAGEAGTGGAAGSSGDGGTGGTGGTGGAAGSAGDLGAGVNYTCHPIGNGQTTVEVNGKTRTFAATLPSDTSKMALLFLWHGWNQVPATFANEVVYDVPLGKWVPFDPNAFAMPLMIVSPTSTKLLPPAGLDWDIATGAADFPFFEAMMACIQEQYEIDTQRIYSFGFSAGAVFTNLLASRYPHLFAATIAESGMWMNDTPEQADIMFGAIVPWNWPALVPGDRGNVLLTHGGPKDYATVANLETANQKAVPYLYANGRTVVECEHTFGHTLDPDLTQSMYYDYMWAHTLDGPPLEAAVPSFPTQANPVGATSCKFHPHN